VVSGFEIRVGDAEREAAATELREHFATGRLTQDELNERLDQAFAAKTRGDLHAVMTDLPSAHSGPAGGAPGPGTPLEGAGSHWIGPGAGYGRPGGGYGRPGSGYGRPGSGYGRPGGAGYGRRRGVGRSAGSLITSFVLLWALLLFGIFGIFGLGAGRPFGLVLIFAAFALLRRLLIGIFRRRRGGMRGPRRRF
jgi:hypothetical protein